jgi:hypothetical protein
LRRIRAALTLVAVTLPRRSGLHAVLLCTTRELSQFYTRTTCRHGHFRMAFTRFSG